ncbi:MAG: TetR/AcrR family transcriptional regulator [Clostridia bacterium]|nr:TetR/AcrR family transcriptional regulator [Clostridia bacterium]
MEQTRRMRKKDMTHRAIMHSAKLLFEKNGISNVTIEKIADGADVSRSTFFSHFDSLDDLLSQIANEEINDILKAAEKDGEIDIDAVFTKLAEDTYPYPSLMCELVVRSILLGKDSSVSNVFRLLGKEISNGGYDKLKEMFSDKDISALIFGAYFGLIFRKITDKENFGNPKETINKINYFINYLKNQEDNNNE